MNVNMQPLTDADMVLTLCGRPVPPEGVTVVDLSYVLPFHSSSFAITAPVTPSQERIANNSKATFLCKGVVIESPLGVRIKWPSGRYYQQGPTWDGLPAPGNPRGTGGNLIALDSEIEVDRGAKITVEMSGSTAGEVDVQFWGVLRYFLMKQTGTVPTLAMIQDPVLQLEERPRYRCGPPQNIMAPEWYLGNQCTFETPPGFVDIPYTFFSPAITVAVGSQVFGTQVIIPGGDDVVIKRVRTLSDYSGLDGGASAVPVFTMRLPSGYSITGGDMVPALPLFWWPVFPTTRIKYGQRIIIDMADMQGVGAGSITSVFEFDAVKRRRKAA